MRFSTRSLAAVGICLALWTAAGMTGTDANAAASAHPAPKLGKHLKASMHFTKDRYKPGAKAHLDIKVKNTGSARLHGIAAACDRAGDPDELTNRGKSWGALASSARGVTLAPHSTRTFHVTVRVPSAAQRAGQVVVACDFGYRGIDTGYRAPGHDSARVPGQSGALEGDVERYVHGTSGATIGLKNVRVVLVDRTTCPVLTRKATTDAKGHFRIAHAPAGSSYKLYLFTPKGWKVRGGNPTAAMIIGKNTTRFFFEVKPGTARKLTVPKKCS